MCLSWPLVIGWPKKVYNVKRCATVHPKADKCQFRRCIRNQLTSLRCVCLDHSASRPKGTESYALWTHPEDQVSVVCFVEELILTFQPVTSHLPWPASNTFQGHVHSCSLLVLTLTLLKGERMRIKLNKSDFYTLWRKCKSVFQCKSFCQSLHFYVCTIVLCTSKSDWSKILLQVTVYILISFDSVAPCSRFNLQPNIMRGKRFYRTCEKQCAVFKD